MEGADVIHLFQSRKRLFGFPKKWANSVTRWISGVHSPSGTIHVKNTMEPGDDGSIALDVNVGAVAHEVLERFETRPVTKEERKRLTHHLRGMVDGNSVQMIDGHIGVNGEWVDNRINEAIRPTADDDGTGTPANHSDPGTVPVQDGDDQNPWSWSSGEANGLVMDAYALVTKPSASSSYHDLRRVRMTFAANGRLVSAEMQPDGLRIRA